MTRSLLQPRTLRPSQPTATRPYRAPRAPHYRTARAGIRDAGVGGATFASTKVAAVGPEAHRTTLARGSSWFRHPHRVPCGHDDQEHAAGDAQPRRRNVAGRARSPSMRSTGANSYSVSELRADRIPSTSAISRASGYPPPRTEGSEVPRRRRSARRQPRSPDCR